MSEEAITTAKQIVLDCIPGISLESLNNVAQALCELTKYILIEEVED